MGTASLLKILKTAKTKSDYHMGYFQVISRSGILLSINIGFNNLILRPLASLFSFLNIKCCDSEQQVQQSQYQSTWTLLGV